jgi:hypothetical protein
MLTLSTLIVSTLAVTSFDSLYQHDMKQYDSLFQQSTSAVSDTTVTMSDKKESPNKHDSTPVHLGIKIGLGWSNFYGSGADQMDRDARTAGFDPGSRFGMLFGGSYSHDMNTFFTFEIDADYAMKGKKITGSSNGVQETQIIKLNYLELPVMLKVNIPTRAPFKPDIFFGLSISTLLSAENYYKLEYEGNSRDTSISIENVNSPEFGLIFGIGGMETTAEGDISLEARYSLGLTTIDYSEPVSGVIKNWQIAIILGFLFSY